MRIIPILPLLIITAGCTVSSNDVVGLSGISGSTHHNSTEDFSVSIAQTIDPPMMEDDADIDLRFDIGVRNDGSTPVAVKRITLQSMGGGNVQVPAWTRKFDSTLDPQEEETFPFWATARVSDRTVGTRAPLVLRATITFDDSGQERREVFVRRVNANVSIGITR